MHTHRYTLAMRFTLAVLLFLGLFFFWEHQEPPADAATEQPFVMIADMHLGRRLQPPQNTIVYRTLTPADEPWLEGLYELALAHFPEGTWEKIILGSSHREIVFFYKGQRVLLASCHPIFEQHPNLVASSTGVGALNGVTRADYLAADDRAYVRRRVAFDHIEHQIRRQTLGPQSAPGIPKAIRAAVIHLLIQNIKTARTRLHEQGIDDGSGLLYRSIPAYTTLKALCTDAELEQIETGLFGRPQQGQSDTIWGLANSSPEEDDLQ